MEASGQKNSGGSYVEPNAIECYQEAHRKEEALTTTIIIVLRRVVFDLRRTT